MKQEVILCPNGSSELNSTLSHALRDHQSYSQQNTIHLTMRRYSLTVTYTNWLEGLFTCILQSLNKPIFVVFFPLWYLQTSYMNRIQKELYKGRNITIKKLYTLTEISTLCAPITMSYILYEQLRAAAMKCPYHTTCKNNNRDVCFSPLL